jgi:hypothetical protein
LDDIGDHGLPVDRSKQAELRTYALTELNRLQREMHAGVPAEVLSIHPKAGYKSRSARLELVEAYQTWQAGEKVKLSELAASYDPSQPPVVTAAGHTGYLAVRDFKTDSPDPATIGEYLAERRLCIERLYNPHASSPNTKSYIRYRGYRMPVSLATGNETTGRNELRKLAKETGDRILDLTDKWRELRKTGLDYTTGKWVPGEDGRVHGTFRCGTTGSGQTSCTDPNLQQFPEHSGIAKRAKEAIRAEPGHLFVKCVSPQTRLLMSDLTWRRAGEVKVGDSVIGFDEFPVRANRKGKELIRPSRYLRHSQVVRVSNLRRPSVKIHTSKGVVVCSIDHQWLCRGQSKLEWTSAGDIRPGDEISFFTWPWEVDTSWEAGWLAGFMDGEGYVRGSKLEGNHRGAGFGQNAGLTADYAIELIEKRGFQVSRNSTQRETQLGLSKCIKHEIVGHAFAWLRFLGMVRPQRLLNTAIPAVEGMSYWGRASSPAVVIAVHNVGEQAAVAIETETHTYIAEGMLSHNCDMRGFHSRAVGWIAKDRKYYELADCDVHSYITAHFVHHPLATHLDEMDDSELRAALSSIKDQHTFERNYKIKRVVHGRQFNMGVRKLYDMHAENFNPNEAQMIAEVGEAKWFGWDKEKQLDEAAKRGRREAQQLFSLFDQLFPGVFILYPQKVREQLYTQMCRLTTPFGHHRWLWNWDLEQGAAFGPSNCAHCHIQSALIRLRGRGALREFGCCNFTHDAGWFHPTYELVDRCVAIVQEEFDAPSTVLVDNPLGPFQCNSDAEVGPDMANMIGYGKWVKAGKPTAEQWATAFPLKEKHVQPG